MPGSDSPSPYSGDQSAALGRAGSTDDRHANREKVELGTLHDYTIKSK